MSSTPTKGIPKTMQLQWYNRVMEIWSYCLIVCNLKGYSPSITLSLAFALGPPYIIKGIERGRTPGMYSPKLASPCRVLTVFYGIDGR
jgi:hypothetical protein